MNIVVLHGITMCGAAMRHTLGPLGPALEAAGFGLLFPDGPPMPDSAVERVADWARGQYAQRGQDSDVAFAEGRFWGATHHGWLQPETTDGARVYTALEASFSILRDACRGRDVVGVIGFSEGCAMAALFAGLAQRDPSMPRLRFGVFLSGFRPTFDRPVVETWPVDLPARFAVGARDAVFPDPQTLRALAAEFVGAPEVEVMPAVDHDVNDDPEWVARTVAFVVDAAGREATR